ncbi:MAG: thiamine-phosphate kinase [Sulfurifustis sp.]
MTEFDIIRNYFNRLPSSRPDVRVGIGDDAAICLPPPGMETVATTDVLNAGVHFLEDVDPAALGHKSLAVNLSDLAAVGAEPAWFLLGLTLPTASPAWLEQFTRGLFALAQRYNVQLIGGDTTRGPLSIAITAIGLVPQGKGLLRAGAKPGDLIYVTGTLGDAALALDAIRGVRRFAADELALLRERLERPVPRVAEGAALRDIASSGIDVSDGLLGDLGHILEASGVGARVRLEAVPLSPTYRTHLTELGWDYALGGGDDYELCFTVPPLERETLDVLASEMKFPLTLIGEITAERALNVYDAAGRIYRAQRRGYDHFST